MYQLYRDISQLSNENDDVDVNKEMYNEDDEEQEQDDEKELDPCFVSDDIDEPIEKGADFKRITEMPKRILQLRPMEKLDDPNCHFMISPFKYDAHDPDREPRRIHPRNDYMDIQSNDYVRMPCSTMNKTRNGKPLWKINQQILRDLKEKCERRIATVKDFEETIQKCMQYDADLGSLGRLFKIYTKEERQHFLLKVLPCICDLAINVDCIFTKPPPLLRFNQNRSVTMSQRQAASLLACSVFCLFPCRSGPKRSKEYKHFPNPNFNRYISSHVPNGVITYQRVALSEKECPAWENSRTLLCEVSVTNTKKIENIPNVLQVDFANRYIGGGVLGSGCVQEEIRFSICPEMLVSLLLCERMEIQECVMLIGCERFCSYKGYSNSFEFNGDYQDKTPKDDWGRKFCHVVAMDALFYRKSAEQYEIGRVKRELIKAYASFRPLEDSPEYSFGIATGNWGCGAFNGDKYLKAIIQCMAASEAKRPLIYAAYRDTNFVDSLGGLIQILKEQKTSVSDLYGYLDKYLCERPRQSLFDYISNEALSLSKSSLL